MEFKQELTDYINKAIANMLDNHETTIATPSESNETMFEVFDQVFKLKWPEHKLISVDFDEETAEFTFEYDTLEVDEC